MSNRIIILGNEPELLPLAQAIDKTYNKGQAEVLMYNDENIGQKTSSDNLYLIGHADAKGIGDYAYSDLVIHFGAHLKGAATAVYLSGCSTASEAAQILKSGFVPATLAANVKAYTGKTVYGTPGVLVLTLPAGQLSVVANLPYKATDIFIKA
jgi:hypothetical protein